MKKNVCRVVVCIVLIALLITLLDQQLNTKPTEDGADEEVIAILREAYDLAEKEMEEVTYSYGELFA